MPIPNLVDLITLWFKEEHLKLKVWKVSTIVGTTLPRPIVVWGILHQDAEEDSRNFLGWIYASDDPYVFLDFRKENRFYPADPEFFDKLYDELVKEAKHLSEPTIV